jgi:predicted CoA-binding protein
VSRDIAKEFVQQRTIAVVGVSSNTDKYGYKVWRNLRGRGYRVLGVNPRLEALEGERIYPSLAALPEKPDGVVVITPPKITEQIVDEAADAGIPRFWMQPGAESDEAIARAEARGLRVVHDACVMLTHP